MSAFIRELTGRENVFLNAAIHGLSGPETEAIYHDIVSYSGLEHFIDVPIKNYSSGMYMRLGFAIAANLDPDILLLDEIFAVGDADFQQRCVDTVKGFMEQGKTVVFVSHSPEAVRTICRRACVLDHGELAFDGDVEGGLEFYNGLLHPHEPRPPGCFPSRDNGRRADRGASCSAGRRTRRTATSGAWLLRFSRRGKVSGQRTASFTWALPVSRSRNEWRSFLDENHYVRLVNDASVFGLGNETGAFDVAIADSVFPCRPFNAVARCIASVVRMLEPSGRFYATWFENPDPANFEPIVQTSGVTTFSDSEPYHYPFALIANVCEAVGARVERMPAAKHPRGESLLVISRRT